MLIGVIVACCGQAFADDKVTYSSDVHPTQIYSLKSFYDIDGDGILEVVGGKEHSAWNRNIVISKINGKLLNDYSLGSSINNLVILNNSNHIYILTEQKVGYTAYLFDYPSLKQLALEPYSCFANNGSNSFTFLGAPNRTDSTFTVWKQQVDGTLIESKISYTSDVSQLKSIAISNCPPSGLNNPSSLGDGMFVRAKENNWVDWKEESTMAKGARSIANDDDDEKIKTEDLNGDGLVDFVLGKYIYYNLGNDKFFLSPHVGTIYPADFNGDGLLDYIDFGNGNVDLYLTQTDGKLAEKKTIFTNEAMQNAFFGDFDKDGDVDILLFIPTSDATYTVFFRNDGNGAFKKKESYIDGKYTSFECKDYDADGLYEILVSNAETSKDYLLKCNKNFTTDLVELPEGLNKILADFNHDGITEINSGASYTPLANAKKNTRPEKMSKPIAVLQPEDGKLKITWKQGKDAQTSSCDLTYELRIGTAPGKGDVLFGHALADGTRRNLMDGSMGRSLKYLFDASYLTEGKYYIAVQAVDAGNMGGEWSDEFVYEHQQVAVPTIMPIPSTYCTADTIALRVQNGRKDATYTWNIPHGKVISASDNNDNVNVVFDKAGELSVGVQMAYNGHVYKSQDVSLLLSPATKPTLKVPEYKDFLLDLDQDGNMELKERLGGLVKLGPTNEYSSIKKSWNTDLSSGRGFAIFDFNKDGYPDMFLGNLRKGNTFINSGEQDCDFEYSMETYTNLDKDNYMAYDIDNDGNFDQMLYENFVYKETPHTGYCYYNTGDNHTFQKIADGTFYDFNADGALDYYSNKYVRLKNKNEIGPTYGEQILFYQHKIDGFADFNNDGYLDGWYMTGQYKGEVLRVVIVKGKPIEEWPCSEIIEIPISMNYPNIIDIDNNGYLDLVFSDRDCGYAILMGKDFNYNIVNISSSFYSNDQYYERNWLPLTRNAYPAGLLSNIKNEAPKAPQYVSAQQTEDGLLLKWADAEDDHTPAVQMRYNVSVKRKNKKVGEENAFLISPLNGLSDEAAICSNVAYRKATQMLIPKAALTNGETLEVQVQSIDLMGEHSPMTKPVEVTINNDGYIKVKDSHVTASLGTVVSFVGTKGTSYSIDGGEGATIKKDYGNGEYLVAWNTSGTKKVTITVDGKAYSTNIIAHDFADLTLDFPAKVLRNTPITVKVPKGFSQYSPIDYGFKAADNYVVNYEKGDSTATFTFKNSGEAKVCTFCKFDNSELSKENNVNVIDASMPAAKISEVIGDGTNYRISWQPATNAEIAKVEICRETNRMNQYEVLATVDMNVGTYLDETSDNRIQAHRYRIRYIASNEVQKSAYSTPHNPLHVMINQCGSGYNLMWNAYEGMNVESYTILRGKSEDSLQPIEYVAGSQQSYTDLTANAGKYYYAVAFTPASGSTYAKSRAARASHGIRSNIISTEEALPATLATSIAINCVESNNSLTNTQQTIHLYGVVLPTYSTYSRVSWSVVRNDDLASISNNGVLTAKGGRGLVTVRATTLDGSNLYVDYDVACNVDKEAVGIVIVEKDSLSTDVKPIIYYDLEGRKIQTPARGHLYITNKGQKIVF